MYSGGSRFAAGTPIIFTDVFWGFPHLLQVKAGT